MDFFCAQSMWTYNEAAIKLVVAVFFKWLQQHGHEFRTKLNFWRRKLYKIGLDSFLYLSWFTETIKTTICSSRLFSTDLERHQCESDPVNAIFLNCLCSSIFLENSRVYFPFLSTDCLQWNSIPMMLASVFLDVSVSSVRSNNFARSMCASLRSKQKCLLFCQHLNYKSVATINQSWSLSLV